MWPPSAIVAPQPFERLRRELDSGRQDHGSGRSSRSTVAIRTSPVALRRSSGVPAGSGPSIATGRPRSVISIVSPCSTLRSSSLARCRSSRTPTVSTSATCSTRLGHRKQLKGRGPDDGRPRPSEYELEEQVHALRLATSNYAPPSTTSMPGASTPGSSAATCSTTAAGLPRAGEPCGTHAARTSGSPVSSLPAWVA